MASALGAINAAPVAATEEKEEKEEEDEWASDKENETNAMIVSAIKAKLSSPRRLERMFASDASNRVYSPQTWNGKRAQAVRLGRCRGCGQSAGFADSGNSRMSAWQPIILDC